METNHDGGLQVVIELDIFDKTAVKVATNCRNSPKLRPKTITSSTRQSHPTADEEKARESQDLAGIAVIYCRRRRGGIPHPTFDRGF